MTIIHTAYCPYELTPVNKRLGHRQGALLKIVFADGLMGYADCHPWPELGDIPLSEQIVLFLQRQLTTPHLRRAQFFASLDAEARDQQVSLFEGLTIPANHYLALDLHTLNLQKVRDQGFERFKFKITPQQDLLLLKRIFRQLEGTACKVRLDSNLKFTHPSFEAFLEDIKEHLALIDFYEDPFPYQAELWKAVQEKYAISLACDRNSEQAINCPDAARVLVIKPALQDETLFLKSTQKIIITSSLDHPLGQLCAAYVAAKVNASRVLDLCGLLSHHAYVNNPFSESLQCHGPFLKQPIGIGMGLDDLLETLPWKENL